MGVGADDSTREVRVDDGDGADGDWFVFEALDLTRRGIPTLWLKKIKWVDGWPVLE